MDRAGGWCLRPRSLNDILRRELRRMWPRRKTDEAETILALADDPDVLPHQMKAAVRAAAVSRALAAHPDNVLLLRKSLITGPLQRILNHVQKMDPLLCDFTHLATAQPGHPEMVAKRRKCILGNRKVLSGQCGQEACDTILEFIEDLEHDVWEI